MDIDQNPEVLEKFQHYPKHIREKLLNLRHLVIETASEIEGIDTLKETLKWGEPSYLAKGGSTIRIGWKPSSPEQYGMFFNCQTKLVKTFRKLYPHDFNFESNRAIVFNRDDTVPVEALKRCIALSLTYHKIKRDLPVE